ncbi:MAG: hypothetical protein ACOC8Y_03015 [Candidatus Natronoplasma sp.]
MKEDDDGIGGFFLDIPVLLLIILVVMVFTTSFYQVYIPIQEEKDRMAQDRICIEVKNSLQNYQKILAEENEKFSMEKLEVLEEERLRSHLKLEADYDYNISFEVLESEEVWYFGQNVRKDDNSESGISSYRTPVSLVDEAGISHLGKLEVNVWRD